MKIGIITYDLSQMRGGSKLALTLANELQKKKHEVRFCAVYEDLKFLEQRFGEKYDFQIYKPNKPFLGKKITNISANWNLNPQVNKMCKEFTPDIVIEIGGVISSLNPAIKLKIPTIHYTIFPASCYADINIYKTSLFDKVYSKLSRKIELSITKKITKIVSMCTFIKKLIKQIWKVDSDTIFPPVNTDLIKPLKKKNQILVVAVINKTHKIEELIENFKKLNRPDYSLNITGQLPKKDEPYYNYLQKKYKDQKNVTISTSIPFTKIQKLYGESKIFWYPIWTHYGLTMAEAQSAGTIVIAPGKGMGVEDIVQDQKTGFVVEKFEDIFKQTKILLENETKMSQMSKAARKNAVDRLSLSVFTDKFEKVISKTLKP